MKKLFNYSFLFLADYLTASPMPSNQNAFNQPPDDSAFNDKYLLPLEKQLKIEMSVKNGTENMIQSISQSNQSRDKKLLAEAYTMLDDSKAKIEFLKLKILKVKQNRELSRVSTIIDGLSRKLEKFTIFSFSLLFSMKRRQLKTEKSDHMSNSNRLLKNESKSYVIA
jgi:hypothetical protein